MSLEDFLPQEHKDLLARHDLWSYNVYGPDWNDNRIFIHVHYDTERSEAHRKYELTIEKATCVTENIER